MNYFELFNIPVSLSPNQQQLKQKFYELSRKYHPDFYTRETDFEQSEALEKSSLVNKAYKTFKNRDEIIKYILQQKGLLQEEEKFQLPPDFLMEVMELNEQLMEAKMEDDDAALSSTKSSIASLQKQIYEPVESLIENYNDETVKPEELQLLKEYYFKKKYLDRILATIQS
ncbi:MAG: Fe-S protein assembly co-chaperone HscB [Segetibacter sp.]|nr:Fe-S protein assembly co-chaperone HscB [Segetibacter sp.]